MKGSSTFRGRLNGAEGARLVVVAQLLVLGALGLGLAFVVQTTGGTLFLAAAVAPGLTALAVLMAASVLIYRYRKRHSLFSSEIFEPGEIVFRMGDVSECAYFIRSGEVEVIQEGNGREIVVARLSEGEYFGEMALLSNAPRNATVRARTRTVTEAVGKENFLTMLNAVRSAREDVTKTVKQRSLSQTAGSGSLPR